MDEYSLALRLVGKHRELINSLVSSYISRRDIVIVKLNEFRIIDIVIQQQLSSHRRQGVLQPAIYKFVRT